MLKAHGLILTGTFLGAAILTLAVGGGYALAHGGGGGGGGGGGMGGGMGGGHSGGMGGGGFGGGFGGMSMGSGGSRGMSGLGGMNFGGAGGIGGLGGNSNFRSVGPNLNGGSNFSARSLSGAGGQFSGSAAGRDFSSLSRSSLSGSGLSGSSLSRSLSGSSRGDALHTSWSKNWDQGEHLGQSHDGFARDGQFHNDHFHDDHFHDGNFNHFNNFHNRNCFVVAPYWWPVWFGAFDNCFYGYDYGGYAPYCYYTVGYNYDDNPPVDYGAANGETLAYDNSIAAPAGDVPPEYPQPSLGQQGNNAPGASQAGAEFFGQAAESFHGGKYRDALRLANHAAVESPQNPKAPELMSISMFALGDYRAAAAQAHAALAMGPPTDWATLYGYYGDSTAYTTQLRSLEKNVKENPKAPEGHFLLAYQYLMTGFTPQAVKELREVIKVAPNDRLAADLLKKYSGESKSESLPAPPPPGNGAPIPPQSSNSSNSSPLLVAY